MRTAPTGRTQAGRYLPEYRAIRAQAGTFLDLCYTPRLAAEVTLQPIRRFGFDAAILFSDILVIPHVLGQDVQFVEGEGPRLEPVASMADLNRLAEALRSTGLIPSSKRSNACAPRFQTIQPFSAIAARRGPSH